MYKFKYKVFSDTIIVYSDKKDRAGLDIFYRFIINILIESINLDLPLRGGISYGDTYIDEEKDIFLGEAIVKAHDVEQSQNWCGLSTDGTFINHPGYYSEFNKFFISEYKSHLKNNEEADDIFGSSVR